MLRLDVTIPGNATGEVWVPTLGKGVVSPPAATYDRDETRGDTTYAVYTVAPGSYTFRGGIGSPRQQVPR